jgi:paraquat-inducible protein B
LNFRIPVLIAIEPDRIELVGDSAIPEYQVMAKLVGKGLRARQRTGNLLTGQSYVSLQLHAGDEPQEIRTDDVYPVLPTIPNVVEAIADTAKRLLDRFNRLPLDETLKDIRAAARQVEAMTGSAALESAIDNIDESFATFKKVTAEFDSATLFKLHRVLEQAEKALNRGEEALTTANMVLGEGAPVVNNLNRLLLELQDAARAVETLADYLERHPDAIVFGKGNPQ